MVWRAHVENGDKPGIGIELVQRGSKVSGSMFILDADKPGDFGAGLRCPMQITQASKDSIRFAVDWTPDNHEELTLLLAGPLQSVPVRAVLHESNGDGAPMDYLLRRIR